MTHMDLILQLCNYFGTPWEGWARKQVLLYAKSVGKRMNGATYTKVMQDGSIAVKTKEPVLAEYIYKELHYYQTMNS